ncbi:MAG: BamA/TamA family outer membrane protein [Aureispira sp.]
MKDRLELCCLLCCVLLMLLGSCGNRKYLQRHSKSTEQPHKRVYDEHWVVKNKLNLDQQNYKIQEDADNLWTEISTIIQQNPSNNFLRTWLYYNNDTLAVKYTFDRTAQSILPDTIRRKANGFRAWLHNTIGKAPTVLDTMLTRKTANSMRNFLHQKAYFHAKIDYNIRYKRHKAIVEYTIQTGKPLLIDQVAMNSQDSSIQVILERIASQTVLKQGEPLSLEKLTEEKRRITLAIRNQGYYEFNWNYIDIKADTANARKITASGAGLFDGPVEQGEPRANLYLEVLPFSDTMIHHPRYKVNNVFITPNEFLLKVHQKRQVKQDSFFVVERTRLDRIRRVVLEPEEVMQEQDSLLREWITPKGKRLRIIRRSMPRVKKMTLRSRSEIQTNDRLTHIILRKAVINRDGTKGTEQQVRKRAYIRDKVISDAVEIEAGMYYSYADTRESVRKIDKLGVFRFPRIEYVPAANGDPYSLDCLVKMQPGKKQNVGADVDINNNQTTVSSLGISTSLSYQNKNVFKGAEIFEISAFGGIDFKIPDANNTNDLFFEQAINLLDINLETSVYFPRHLGLNFVKRLFKMERPSTRVAVGYRYLQQSTDFQISSFYTKFGYDWSKGTRHAFAWNPLVINLTSRPILDPDFGRLLEESNRALYESLSASFLIPSMDFSYTYSDPSNSNKRGTWYLKTTFEVAGNLLYALDQIVQPNTPMQILGVDYSQYFSTDIDLRYSYKISQRQSIVSRLMVGIVVPYGNSIHREVPFVKRFTLGGPTSMRAWDLRFLGPGNQPSVNGAEFQLGDFRTEFNTEYRFNLNSWISAALFVDIGNVWLLDGPIIIGQDVPLQTPKSGLLTERFYEELAIGAGAGLRFDVSFFVIRFDLAVQLREPQGYGLLDDGTVQYWNFNPFVFAQRNKFIIAIGYPF